MKIKDIIEEDFIQYKKPSMFIITSKCDFKCERDCGCTGMCQNSSLVNQPTLNIKDRDIVKRYVRNNISSAIVFGGLEPIDQMPELIPLIEEIRKATDDDIVIYTGYYKEEIPEQINTLTHYKNIIVKFGRYIPGHKPHKDDILGVYLSSNNQYAEIIS